MDNGEHTRNLIWPQFRSHYAAENGWPVCLPSKTSKLITKLARGYGLTISSVVSATSSKAETPSEKQLVPIKKS